jgi:hypothetical protein
MKVLENKSEPIQECDELFDDTHPKPPYSEADEHWYHDSIQRARDARSAQLC